MISCKKEAEVIQLGIYVDIILNILKNHNSLSLTKTIVFSYIIKKDKFYKTVYKSNNKKNVVNKAISLLTGEYEDFCVNVNYIIKSVHLLIKTNKIQIEDTILSLSMNSDSLFISKLNYCEESNFIKKAIESSKKISDKQFMKEVLANV